MERRPVYIEACLDELDEDVQEAFEAADSDWHIDQENEDDPKCFNKPLPDAEK